MNEKLYIPVVLGTGREERRSENVAKFVHEQVKKLISTELIDVRDYATEHTIPSWEKSMQSEKWRNIMVKADGLIIVAPEYNHGYPGELKILLDKLYDEYNRKPVAICGVATGGLGGARMVEMLRISLIELKMVPIRNAVYFSSVKELFDEDGNIKDESYKERVSGMLEELTWYAKALKTAREED